MLIVNDLNLKAAIGRVGPDDHLELPITLKFGEISDSLSKTEVKLRKKSFLFPNFGPFCFNSVSLSLPHFQRKLSPLTPSQLLQLVSALQKPCASSEAAG